VAHARKKKGMNSAGVNDWDRKNGREKGGKLFQRKLSGGCEGPLKKREG